VPDDRGDQQQLDHRRHHLQQERPASFSDIGN
jgi:hypothetical protein